MKKSLAKRETEVQIRCRLKNPLAKGKVNKCHGKRERKWFKQKHKSKHVEEKNQQTGETQFGREGAKGIRRCSQPRRGSLNLEASCWKMGPWLCFCWLFSELILSMQNRHC